MCGRSLLFGLVATRNRLGDPFRRSLVFDREGRTLVIEAEIAHKRLAVPDVTHAVSTRPEQPVPLEARGIVKRWSKDLPPVLAGISFSLERGSCTWIGGRN